MSNAGMKLDPEAVAERWRLYAAARESGSNPWEACIAAGWDIAQRERRERWYQAMIVSADNKYSVKLESE